MKHTLNFKSNKELKSLARETLSSKVFHQPYTKETTEQRGIFLVKDEGIYLMDAYADKHPNSYNCLLYTSPSPRDGLLSRMPSSA